MKPAAYYGTITWGTQPLKIWPPWVFKFYSKRPRGGGFRLVIPTERWHENPASTLVWATFSHHLDCEIHRSESSPEGSFTLISHTVTRWAKLLQNDLMCASANNVLSTGRAELRCLQTWLVRAVIEIPQSRIATTTSWPPVQDIRDTMNSLTEGLWPISDAHKLPDGGLHQKKDTKTPHE